MAVTVFGVGKYVIAHDNMSVRSSFELMCGGKPTKVIAQLAKGTEVKVVEVRRLDDPNSQVKRIRGRIADPVGWISLENPSNGYRWVTVAATVAATEDRKRKRGYGDTIAKHQWDHRRFTDCSVVSSCDTEFRAHRSVLDAASPVLSALFDSGMREGVDKRVVINAAAGTVETALRWMYTGELLDGVAYLPLLEVAVEYQLGDLVSICTEGLVDGTDTSNVIPTLRALRLHMEHERVAASWGALGARIKADPELFAAVMMTA